jgi:hypothetical protein
MAPNLESLFGGTSGPVGDEFGIGAFPLIAGPEQVLQYLGRYTHRIAIANVRLVSCTDGVVQFRWKDYADHERTKIMALGVEEFLRRFLLHVLPRRFVRIRHFGLLANHHRRATIACARQLLHAPAPVTPSDVVGSADVDRSRCPFCRQGRWHVEILPPLVGPTTTSPDDTS